MIIASKKILTTHICLFLFLYKKTATKEAIPSKTNTKGNHHLSWYVIIAKTAIKAVIRNK